MFDTIPMIMIHVLLINGAIGSTNIEISARQLSSQRNTNNKWNNPDIFTAIAPFITDNVEDNPFKSVSTTARDGTLAFKTTQSSNWYQKWLQHNFHLVLNETKLSLNDLSAFEDITKFTIDSIEQEIFKSFKINPFIHPKMPIKWKGVELSTGKSYLAFLIRTVCGNEIGLLSILFDHNKNGTQIISNVAVKTCLKVAFDRSVFTNPFSRISINFVENREYQFVGPYSNVLRLISDNDYVWSASQNDVDCDTCKMKVATDSDWRRLDDTSRTVRRNAILWSFACFVANVFYVCSFFYWVLIGNHTGALSFFMSFVVVFVFSFWTYF